jgi:preprotein translocase subunit YajC
MNWEQLFPMVTWLLIWLALLWVLIVLPQQRRQRERDQFLNSLKPGDEVATTGGICGRILSVDGDTVTLRIADGVDIKVLKSGIARRLDKEEAEKLRSVLRKGGR